MAWNLKMTTKLGTVYWDTLTPDDSPTPLQDEGRATHGWDWMEYTTQAEAEARGQHLVETQHFETYEAVEAE